MSIPWSIAFFVVGGVLVFLGLLLALIPGPGLLVLLIGLLHVGVGLAVRSRERRTSV